MALTKQARMLAPEEIETVAGWIVTTRQDSVRDLAILYLSVYAGFRAKEIANLSWEMVNQNRDGCIHLTNAASKGFTGGRVVPIHPKLDAALAALARSHAAPPSGRIIRTRRGEPVSPHYVVKKFGYWYWLLDMKGCSSHSGRRTFITTAAPNDRGSWRIATGRSRPGWAHDARHDATVHRGERGSEAGSGRRDVVPRQTSCFTSA